MQQILIDHWSKLQITECAQIHKKEEAYRRMQNHTDQGSSTVMKPLNDARADDACLPHADGSESTTPLPQRQLFLIWYRKHSFCDSNLFCLRWWPNRNSGCMHSCRLIHASQGFQTTMLFPMVGESADCSVSPFLVLLLGSLSCAAFTNDPFWVNCNN